MGTENNTTYLTLTRERGHRLTLVITAENQLPLSHQECWVHISPSDLSASHRCSGRTMQEELALGLIAIKFCCEANDVMASGCLGKMTSKMDQV